MKGNSRFGRGKGDARRIPVQEVTKDAPDMETNQTEGLPPTQRMPKVGPRPGEEVLYEADGQPRSPASSDASGAVIDDDALLDAVNNKDIEEEQDAGQEVAPASDERREDVPQDGEQVPVRIRQGDGGQPRQDDIAPIREWASVAPDFRVPEATFVLKTFGNNLSVDDSGRLLSPVSVGDWVMLLVYDSRFPRPAEHGPAARLYFVAPTPEVVSATTGIPVETFSCEGDGGERYLVVDGFDDFQQTYMSGRSDILMAERLLSAASELKGAYDEAKAAVEAAQASRPAWTRPTITHRHYEDTRTTTPGARQHPACRKVVLSDRAFVQIYNETQAHIRTETGGLLLGHYENGVWYVVEASDPGWDAVFRQTYHEANEHYENHVCEIMSRTYRHPLAFLGMWHRHPGDLDTFSGTDDETNSKYVDACGNGCISALVNYDPDYRLTFYYVERTRDGGVAYSLVDVEVGDGRFDNPAILELARVPYPARGVSVQPDPPEDGGVQPGEQRQARQRRIPATSTKASAKSQGRKAKGNKAPRPDGDEEAPSIFGGFPFSRWF